MKYIGAHVSSEPEVSEAPLEARAIGARAFALFTRAPQRWSSPPLKAEDIALFKERCREFGYSPDVILPHDSFLINLGSPDRVKLAMSRKAFLDEMQRCEQLGLTMLNFHPGSHVGKISEEACLDLIAESVNKALDRTSGVKAVLENTAGQGTNLGYRFEHLAYIIERIEDKSRVGVCIDTCHTLAAGYDLTGPEAYSRTWEEFGRTIGFEYLSGLHINDSKKPLDSRIDRHESINRGHLKGEFWRLLMNDPRLDGIPIILETPDPTLWPQEIEWLYSLVGT